MSKSRLIRLHSNGNIVNTEEILGIVRKDINAYGILIKNCQAVLAADGSDVDAIIEYLQIPTLVGLQVANDTKIAEA